MKTFPQNYHVIALNDEELAILNAILRHCGGPGRLNRLASDLYYDMPTSPLDNNIDLIGNPSVTITTEGKK